LLFFSSLKFLSSLSYVLLTFFSFFSLKHQIKTTQNRISSSLPYPVAAASPSEGRCCHSVSLPRIRLVVVAASLPPPMALHLAAAAAPSRCQAPLSSATIAPLAVAVVPGPPMIFPLRRGQICLASRAVMPPPNRRRRGLQ
ncbi:hypothetical protein LINPERPRIM_LOCUS37305, partial [Linum perenne]